MHEVTALHSFDALHNNEKVSVLVTGSEQGSIRIWSVKSGECLQLIMGHEKKVVSFESIGMSKLASSSVDGTIRIWDISFRFLFELSDSFVSNGIFSLQIPQSEQDPAMFVLACENLIQVYDSTTGAFIRNILTYHEIGDMKYIGGHQIAIAYFYCLIIGDVKTGTCEQLFYGKLNRCTCSKTKYWLSFMNMT